MVSKNWCSRKYVLQAIDFAWSDKKPTEVPATLLKQLRPYWLSVIFIELNQHIK
jgi:hypothetical protein